MLRIGLSFDYDSPAGHRESFHLKDCPANADQEGTLVLLEVLQQHNVRATFGIVGHAALPGEPPEHCQDQIRAIHAAGHEIASHSMTHRFLPPMRDEELVEEVATSKATLENCIGAPVRGFIPPFNRPMHFPARGAFSLAEMLGTQGRGRGRQSVDSMLRTLRSAGYGWSRVSYENKFHAMARRLRLQGNRPPTQPFLWRGIVAIPLHMTGFGADARALIRGCLDSDLVLTLYAHPNQATAANSQSAPELDRLMSDLALERSQGALEWHTMGEVEDMVR